MIGKTQDGKINTEVIHYKKLFQCKEIQQMKEFVWQKSEMKEGMIHASYDLMRLCQFHISG